MYILIELGELSLRNRIEMKNLVQDEYIQMLVDVAKGLMFIHEKKIIHRDIKPENVIYSKGIYKITDFGTCIMQESTNEIAGTVVYWAPEILFDEEDEFTQAVDIWSFGVMAF
jgi:serine/threonine protein kinase